MKREAKYRMLTDRFQDKRCMKKKQRFILNGNKENTKRQRNQMNYIGLKIALLWHPQNKKTIGAQFQGAVNN